jgi:spermidine synthase
VRYSPGKPSTLLLALFFVGSGFSALAYQVILSRYAQLIVGATAFAVSALLTAFMLGMSLGAGVGGRLADRTRHPLRVYAAAEGAIGVYCLGFPLLFPLLQELYLAIVPEIGASSALSRNLVRFVLGVSAFLLPTFFMGMTTPAFARAVASEREGSGAWLARLYGWNTLGAALGALVTAYVLVPSLGLLGSLALATTINFSIALAAYRASRPVSEPAPRATAPPPLRGAGGAPRESPVSARTILALVVLALLAFALAWASSGIDFLGGLMGFVYRRSIPIVATLLLGLAAVLLSRNRRALGSGVAVFLIAAFASGYLSFALEVLWTHLLAILLGNSVYAFGLMLGSLLLGLAIGTLFARKLAAPPRRARNWIGLSLSLAGLSILLTLPLWDEIPRVFLLLARREPSFGLMEAVRFAAALTLMLLPTAAFGITFPLTLSCATSRGSGFGARVGQVYAVNTVGAVAGALSGPYFFLPSLGSQLSLQVLAALLLAAGGLALAATSEVPFRRALVALAVTSLLWAPAIPVRWNFNALNMAAAVYLGDSASAKGEILFRREDPTGGLTTVVQDRGVKTLLTNGKFQGDNAEEIPVQHRAANLPTLFTAGRERALVVGLGTGVTLAALAAHGFGEIVCAELSRPIIEAAREHFSDVNGGILDAPNLRLVEEDGRSVLLESPDRYDVVTVEVSSIWFAGVGSIYSREFYQLAKARLRRHGVLLQWFPIHHLSARNLFLVVNTVRSVFPYVSLWTHRHQAFVIASSSPLLLDLDSIRSDRSRESMAPYLRELPSGSPLELLSDLVVTDADVDRFLDSMALLLRTRRDVVATDAWPTLEYETPKDLLQNFSYFQNRATFRRFRSLAPFGYRGVPEGGEEVLSLAAFSRGWNDPRALSRIARAWREAPELSSAASRWLHDELTGEDAFGSTFSRDPVSELGSELEALGAMVERSLAESACGPLPPFVSRAEGVPLVVHSHAGESLEGTAPEDALDSLYDPDLAPGWRARPDGRPVALELSLLEPRRVEKVHLVARPIDGDRVRTRIFGQDERGTWIPLASGGRREEILCESHRQYRLPSGGPRLSRIRVEIQGEGDSFRVALHEIWIEVEGRTAS